LRFTSGTSPMKLLCRLTEGTCGRVAIKMPPAIHKSQTACSSSCDSKHSGTSLLPCSASRAQRPETTKQPDEMSRDRLTIDHAANLRGAASRRTRSAVGPELRSAGAHVAMLTHQKTDCSQKFITFGVPMPNSLLLLRVGPCARKHQRFTHGTETPSQTQALCIRKFTKQQFSV
jgi:hypothetical protein